MTILGTPVGRLDAAQRRALGLAFVPEERLGRGAVPEMSLADNALLTAHARAWFGMASSSRGSAVISYTIATIKEFGVKTAAPTPWRAACPAATCRSSSSAAKSGWQPKVMIVAQPTWGVDVGAAAQIRQALIDLRDTGVAMLVRLGGTG